MPKLLSIIVLIFSIVLFPPSVLAVISNNAVPGDSTYPIKRSLEDIIYATLSLHPVTKAWFSAARSERRFKEVKILVTSGRSSRDSLQELVIQTDIAAKQIQKVQDPQKKKELISNLKESIEKYDQGLLEIQGSYEKYYQRIKEEAKILETIPPPPAPSPTQPPVEATPVPNSVTPASSTVDTTPPELKNIGNTREGLEAIKKDLEKEKEALEKKKLHQKEEKDEREDRKEDSDKDKEERGKKEGNDDKKTDKEGKDDGEEDDRQKDSKNGKKSGD